MLRSELGLTGSKRGCNHGVCGACTVLLDGKLARSCLTLAADVGERPVTTIEGLAGEEGLAGDDGFSAVQRALIERAPSNAASARPDSSSRSPRCSRASRIPDARPSATPCRATCAAARYVKIVEAAERLAGGRP